MIFRNRPVARLGAAALLASGAFTALGAPAFASGAGTDLAIDVAGTRVAANAEGKVAFAKITNKGTDTPSELAVRVDVSKVDFLQIGAVPAVPGCEVEGTEQLPTAWTCFAAEEGLPGPGETIDLPLVVFKIVDLKDALQVPLTFTLISKDDTNKANDTKVATLDFSKQSGPDLSVIAEDVKQAATEVDGNPVYSGSLYAGGRSALTYVVANQGDVATNGLKVSVKLPAGVTPTEVEPGCEYSADERTFTCTYDKLGLIPQDQDTDESDKLYSAYGFYHLIDVAEGVKPGALTGGLVSVESIVTDAPVTAREAAKVQLPANVEGLRAAEVDASDNSDAYAVVVAAQGGAGGGDEDGGLPVTGPQAGLIGGIGVAVLAAGGAMFLASRRRRVVLVTPGDEKPTA